MTIAVAAAVSLLVLAIAANAAENRKLPRLVDLGADRCIPCKMMAPVLADLKTNYAGRLEVEFIDVWKNPDAGKQYKIRLIPTQIFFDASGKELFRHEGFFGKEDILARWKELGFDLSAPADRNAACPPPARPTRAKAALGLPVASSRGER